jgi:dolichol-phosphate mannosyltransferase
MPEPVAQKVSPAPLPRVLVSLATYNEVENLRDLVLGIRAEAPHADILVVDDASPDGTSELTEQLMREHKGVFLIRRSGKLGLGTAIVCAMKYAIDHGYEFYLNMDADGSHPPRFIPALIAGMQSVDVMIGSRYVAGGGVEGEFGLKRKFMSTGINLYARTLLGLKTKDNSGSFRCYRVAKLAKMDFRWIRSKGYSFQEEILFWCRVVGCTFDETPILFENRRGGKSKLHAGEAVKALEIMLGLGIDRAFGRVPAPMPTPKATSASAPGRDPGRDPGSAPGSVPESVTGRRVK